jgi:hypothetical protein
MPKADILANQETAQHFQTGTVYAKEELKGGFIKGFH